MGGGYRKSTNLVKEIPNRVQNILELERYQNR